MTRMTLEEKCAQLGCMWFSGLLVDGELALDRLALAAADGIGQVGRIAIEAGSGPERVAELGNQVQRYFVEDTRLGIPAVIHEESTGGFCARGATQFPQGINLAATWDPILVEQVANVIGRQLRAVGARLTLAPVLDIARDARWGRLEETYGEDPELASRMGVGYVRGVQAQGVVATAKHFLGYGAPEGGFNWGWSSMGPRHLRDVIAAPFRAVINEAGVGAVMPSYNEIDGLPLHGSRELLTELLRVELGFSGVTVADYFGVSSLEDFHHCANDEADGQACPARRTRCGASFLLVLPPSPCARERRRRPGRGGRCFLSPRAGTKRSSSASSSSHTSRWPRRQPCSTRRRTERWQGEPPRPPSCFSPTMASCPSEPERALPSSDPARMIHDSSWATITSPCISNCNTRRPRSSPVGSEFRQLPAEPDADTVRGAPPEG